jgi:hypothetical protein
VNKKRQYYKRSTINSSRWTRNTVLLERVTSRPVTRRVRCCWSAFLRASVSSSTTTSDTAFRTAWTRSARPSATTTTSVARDKSSGSRATAKMIADEYFIYIFIFFFGSHMLHGRTLNLRFMIMFVVL